MYNRVVGKGTRKKMKRIGKINIMRVRAFETIRTVPMMKIGRDAMWYSNG